MNTTVKSTGTETWETFKVYLDKSLLDAVQTLAISPDWTACGGRWHLRAGLQFPGSAELYLVHTSNENVTIEFTVSYTPTGSDGRQTFTSLVCFNGSGVRSPRWAIRRSSLSSTAGEKATVEVRMRDVSATTLPQTPSLPNYLENPFNKLVMKKFNDEESSDVVFQVGGDVQSTFFAHRFALEACAPMLAQLCGSELNNMDPIPITDVKPEVFRHMLYFVYGGNVSKEELKENTKDIIVACDKYEIVHLKLKAEEALVSSTTITVDNVVEYLLFSDEKNCALLKEAAIDYIVANHNDVLREVSFDNLPPGLYRDFLTSMSRTMSGSGGR